MTAGLGKRCGHVPHRRQRCHACRVSLERRIHPLATSSSACLQRWWHAPQTHRRGDDDLHMRHGFGVSKDVSNCSNSCSYLVRASAGRGITLQHRKPPPWGNLPFAATGRRCGPKLTPERRQLSRGLPRAPQGTVLICPAPSTPNLEAPRSGATPCSIPNSVSET